MTRARFLHALGEDGCLVVAVGDSDADRGGPRARGCPCVHGDHHELVDMIGSLVVQAMRGADHAPWRDVKVTAGNEVRELGVHAGVTVPGQNWRERRWGERQEEIVHRVHKERRYRFEEDGKEDEKEET